PFCADNGRDSGLARHIRWPVVRLWIKILVACLPAGVLGLLLDDWMDAHLYNSVVVAVMLIVYGVAFLLLERRPRAPATTKLSRITYQQALLVGFWQALAMIPGTSRSGATIVGGMLCGMSRPCVSQFTFFLAIPVMAGASGLKLVKFLAGGNTFTGAEITVLALGCLVAFAVSIIAIRFLMDYVKKHTFTAFGWYRIALGILVLAIWGVQTYILA
ncbi:MAG: undecaprenyl-diphosphate phosphatase, partial [Gemmiger sp.]